MRLRVFSKEFFATMFGYYPRVWFAIVRKSLSKSVAYRFELLSKLIRMLLAVALQLILIESIFAETEMIRGWTVDEYYLLVGIFNLINYTSWGIFNVNLWRLEEKVLRGQFDFLLLLPSGSIFSTAFYEFFLDDAISAISGLLLIGYYVVLNFGSITLSGVIGTLIAILIGFTIWFAIHLAVAAINFISVKNGLLDLVKGISRVASFPVDIFSQSIRFILYAVFPVAFVAAVPSRILSNEYGLIYLVYGGLIAIVMLLIARSVWHYSIRSYTSAGG